MVLSFEVYDNPTEKRSYSFEFETRDGKPFIILQTYEKLRKRKGSWVMVECSHSDPLRRRTIPSDFVPIGAFEIKMLSQLITERSREEGWLKGLGSLWPPTRVHDAVLSQFL